MEKERINGKTEQYLSDNSKIIKEKQENLSLPMGRSLKI